MRLSRASRGGAAAATRILGATVTPAAAKASANSRRRVSDERIEHPLLNELEARGAVYLHRIAPSKQCLKVPSKSAGFRKLLILLVGLLPTLLMVRHPTSIGLSTHRGIALHISFIDKSAREDGTFSREDCGSATTDGVGGMRCVSVHFSE